MLSPDAVITPPGPCTFALCQDFEDVAEGSPPSSAVWRRVDSGIVVGKTHAFRGNQAMHIPGVRKGSFMVETGQGLPLAGGMLFGRIYLYVDKAPTLGAHYLHHVFLTARGTNATGNAMQHHFGASSYDDGRAHSFLSYNSWSPKGYSGGKQEDHFPEALPFQSWECIEWKFDSTQSQATFWWNGRELKEIGFTNPAGQATFDFPQFDSISIGWTEFHDTDADWEVWIDEIALADQRIGCFASQ